MDPTPSFVIQKVEVIKLLMEMRHVAVSLNMTGTQSIKKTWPVRLPHLLDGLLNPKLLNSIWLNNGKSCQVSLFAFIFRDQRGDDCHQRHIDLDCGGNVSSPSHQSPSRW
jgi:hypothetical protein